MSLTKHLLIATSLFFVASFPSNHASAQNKKNSTSNEIKVKSLLKSDEVEIVKSSENLSFIMDNGEQVAMPRFDKVLVEKSISSIAERKFQLKNDVSEDVMKNKASERKEMKELSQKLGVDIEDPALIKLYREAAEWLGTRYRRGGMSESAVDCSGFTNIMYNTVFNLSLPRVSTDIAKNVTKNIAKDDLQPGDLVFFSTFGKKYINHVGVYLSDGHFIHASIKRGVIVSSLLEGYYSKAWRKGGRVEK